MTRVVSALLSCLLVLSPARGDDIHVAVATNFLSTAQTLAQHFEALTGDRVVISSGSTGKLYAQIRQGAPYHVFLAADSERPRLLEQQGVAVADSRFTYASGKLVLWSRDRERLGEDPGALRDGRVRRLAIANPKTAPYGRAAQQTLQALDLWQDWKTRVVRGENVGQTLQFAATGNVDAAFVSLAQVQQLTAQATAGWWVVPEQFYEPVTQQAVLLRNDDSAAPRRFLAYLQSPPARQLIQSSGYGAAAPLD